MCNYQGTHTFTEQTKTKTRCAEGYLIAENDTSETILKPCPKCNMQKYIAFVKHDLENAAKGEGNNIKRWFSTVKFIRDITEDDYRANTLLRDVLPIRARQVPTSRNETIINILNEPR